MCIKVQYGGIFYPPKHNVALCNSLKNFKTLKGPYSVRRSWSRHQINTCSIAMTTIHTQPLFPVILGCSTGILGAQPLLRHVSHSSIFSPTDMNFLSPGLYNNLTSTYSLRASQFRSQFNPSTVKVAPDLLISSTGCYLHRCISFFDRLAGSEVNMRHNHLLIQKYGRKKGPRDRLVTVIQSIFVAIPRPKIMSNYKAH